MPRAWLAVALAGALAGGAALACIHAPVGYTGAVSERTKEAFVFHDGTLAHLIVRTGLAAKDGLPGSMAWVIPLPSLPKVMEEAGEGVFLELRALTTPRRSPDRFARGDDKVVDAMKSAAAPTIKVHEAVVSGSYKLQPIEILAESAGTELNVWLESNGFGPVPKENQKAYLRTGAVFLAVRADGLKGPDSQLKPLYLAYAAPEATLPLRFSSHSGELDVVLYTFTQDRQPAGALKEFHLSEMAAVEVRGADFDTRAPDLHKVVGDRVGWLTRYSGGPYNREHSRVTDFTADPGVGADKAVMATGLSSRAIEWMWRVAVVGLLAGAAVLATRFRRMRRQLPWRRRATVYSLVIVGCAGGWFWMTGAYVAYLQRSSIHGAFHMSYGARAEVNEAFSKTGELKGMQGEPNMGYSTSPDGVVSTELDPAALGARLRLTFTPSVKDGKLEWKCSAYPKATLERLEATFCRD